MRRAASLGLWTRGSVAALFAFCGFGCAVLLDWNGYTGGDAGTAVETGPNPGDGASEGGVLPLCGVDLRCAPMLAASSGWQGPVEVFAGPAGNPLPPCGPGYASTPVFEGRGGLVAAPASCAPCECSAPTGGGCAPPSLTLYSDPGCSTPCAADAGVLSTSCVPAAGCAAFLAAAPAPSGPGVCTPGGGNPTYDASVEWSQTVRACMAAGAASPSCGPTEICVASPAAPFPPRLCVVQAGEVTSCPGPPYLDRLIYSSEDVVDTRGCSVCTCAAPAGASCSFSGTPPLPGFRYLDPACTTPTIPFNVPSGCGTLAGAGGLRLVSAPVLDAGSCPPSGGQPLGAVAASAIETFCCTP